MADNIAIRGFVFIEEHFALRRHKPVNSRNIILMRFLRATL